MRKPKGHRRIGQAMPQPFLALEKRIAFDGAAAVTLARAAHDALPHDALHGASHGLNSSHGLDASHGLPRDLPQGVEQQDGHVAATPLLAKYAAEPYRDAAAARVAAQAAAGAKSVVFIESDVPDVATLIRNIDHSADIVLLDSTKDGVAAIASYLAAHKGVEDVYVFSHGSQGRLDLGTAVLDASSMQGRYASDLAAIKGSLGTNANILVYGCDFAEGAVGDGAARLLSQLTGASVAASTNDTGGTREGGDFVLEDRVGTITAPNILKASIASDYDGLLAAPTTIFANSGTGLYHGNIEFLTFANTSLVSGGITNGATATYTTASGSTVTVTFSNVSNASDAASFKPAALNAYSSSKFYGGYQNTATSSALLYGQYNDTASFTVTFSAKDKNGVSYNPNVAFADGEVTESSGEYYAVTTNGGNFQNVETIGSTGYTLSGVGTQSIKLSNTSGGVPLLVTDGATSLGITVQIAGGKEGFVLALVDPTLSLDSDGSSKAAANNYQTTFTEKGSAVAIADTDTAAVEPGGSAVSAKIVLTNAQAGDALTIAQALPSGITAKTDTSVAGQITVTLSGAASLASYQTAIKDVAFSNSSSNPSTADRTINVTYNDGGQDSNTAVSTIHVAAVNDAPVEVVPGSQTTNKDTALTISGMSVSDVDANGGTETVTLSVADGTISLASTSGLTFSKGTGTNDATETFTGTLDAINAAIGKVKYQPTTGYSGSDTLSFSTNDNGNTGSGGAKTASASVAITVNNVNPTANGTIANKSYTDGQSGVSFATAQAFSDSLGLALSYSATGLPKGLTIDPSTGVVSGTVDHDASKGAPKTSGSGATLDGTYTVVETASDGQGGSTTQTFTIDSRNTAPAVGTATANQTSNDGQGVSGVDASKAFSDPNGDPLTYTASGLPTGLSISSAGMITGTVAGNAKPGNYAVTVTATDDKGATASEQFTWTVNDVPPTTNGTLPNQAYADGQSGIAIATAGGFTATNGNALTYSASGLPVGLTIDPGTGKITGTIDHDASKAAPKTSGSGSTLDGTYAVVVTASDGLGGTAQQSFTIDSKNTAPAVGTKTANQTSNDGQGVSGLDVSPAFSDPNGDPLTFAASGLPSGLSISSGGVISGTIAGNAKPGDYAVTVTATDDKGAAASETFTWTVKDVPPTAQGTLPNQTTTDGQSGISIATAGGFAATNGNALTYSASGLPAGLTIDPSTGKITGTIDHDASKNAPTTTGSGATLDGTYAVVVTASDGLGGTAQQSFTIDSKNTAPAVGTATANQTSNDGQTVTAVDASKAFSDPNGDPLTYTASGLPAGLTISSAGMITGTVAGNAKPGNYAVTVTATDDKGAATNETFTWTVKDVPPTAQGTLPNQSTTDGQAGIAIATAGGFAATNGNALTYSASGLPAGLSIDLSTGKITGTVDHDASKNAPTTTGSGATLDGTYAVTVTASDGLGGTAQQSFTINSMNTAPTVDTKTANQTNSDGQAVTPVDASKAFSDANGDPLTFTASNLPAGLTIDPATGIISGTVAANATPGTVAVRIVATDDKGAAARETIMWTIDDVPPTASGTLANRSYADSATVSIATANGFASPNGLTLSYAASGLPAGLSIDPATGAITGQLGHDASKNAPTMSGSGATLDGTYAITVTASDGQGGTATQSFKLDALNQAPTLAAQTPDQHGADGQSVSLDAAKAFIDPNTGDVVTYAASGLPTGLAINAATGLISGTIDPHASVNGPYAVTVTATDDKGAATTESFKWVVDDVPPTATPVLPDRSVNDGTAVSITTAGGFTNPNGVAYGYTATGLPKGLAIDPTTGVISGTIDHDASTGGKSGSYAITVTADDRQGGTATNGFTLTSSNQAPVVGTKTANQGNLDGDAITPVDTSKAFSDPNTDPLTYGASALPAGLVIDPKTGIISGTVSPSAAAGAYSVAITATDDKGLATTETFGWSIGSVPPQASGTIGNVIYADSAAITAIDTASAFTDRNNNALTYSATGLPAGLSIDPATGKITGTLDHDASTNAPAKSGSGASLDGTYTIVVTAADGIGGTATQSFTIDATNQAPTIASNTPTQTNTDGDVVSVNAGEAFVDANTGDVLTFTTGTLPTGLTINPKTGLISGTLQNTDYTNSPYAIAVTATDDKGAATTETFQWIVKQADPTVLSPIPNAASFDGNTDSIATASHFSTDGASIYTASSLPKGLSIDPTTGVISGTIDHDASTGGPNPTGTGRTADSVYSVTVTASNTSNAAQTTQTFSLDVANQAPVVGTLTPAQSNKDDDPIATVDASTAFSDPNGDPLSFTASNLPPGLSIDKTGKITGTVAGNAYPGTYQVTVTATDDKGAATTEVFTWTIADVPPTTSGTLAKQTAADGSGGLSIATAGGFSPTNGNALYYAATGLPPGLTIDPRTGVISGAIGHDASAQAPTRSGAGATLDGTYAITVTAYDGLGGSAVQQFNFDATNTAPAIAAQLPDQHGQDGQAVSIAAGASFTDANGDPLAFTASNLPKGLAIDPATGLITGTIDKSASVGGPYAVTVTATDDKGAATVETFRYVVDDLAPQATPPLADRSVNDGTAVSYATAGGFTNPNGVALSFSATGLPKGLSIDPATGLISGTLDHDASAAVSGGAYAVAVTVDDGQGGTATNSFHLVASNQAPVVGTATADQLNQDGKAITPVDASKAFADPNPGDAVTFVASNLPKGLSIDPATGVISGTVAGDAAPGRYLVTITAADDKGASTSETFTWTIDNVPPTANGTLANVGFNDGQGGVSLATAGGFADGNGNALTYGATGLPRGLTIDPSTGIISGFIGHDASIMAPAKAGAGATLDGTYTVTVTATDAFGGAATQSFTLDARNQAPVLGMTTSNQQGQAGQPVSIAAAQAFADPNLGDVLTFSATGLPQGLSIDPVSGTISGTLGARASATSPATVTVTATDDKGAATSESFTFSVADLPPTAGTPLPDRAANDGQGISLATAGGFDNPNGLPLAFSATGLPKGLAIDPSTGIVSGTLDHDASVRAANGAYAITVTAGDGQGGTASQTFRLVASNQAPLLGTATANPSSHDAEAIAPVDVSKAFSDPNGDPLTYAATGLPPGLSIDPATGLITGTVSGSAPPGSYSVTVTTTDDKGAATAERFSWTITDAPPVATGTLSGQVLADGQAGVGFATAGGFSDAAGNPLNFSASGLPKGLAIDPSTGIVSGTLDHDASKAAPTTSGAGTTLDGTYVVVVTATDPFGGAATQSFAIDARNAAPVVGIATAAQANRDGEAIAPVATAPAFADGNGDPLTYAAAGLPPGLAIDPAIGILSGTVAGNAAPGPYAVTVTATDDKGATATESFAWTIADVPPSAKGTLPGQSLADGQGGVAIGTAAGFAAANGNPLTFTATGLPAGLTIDPATGVISGTLDRDASATAPATTGSGATLDGTYAITVTASDGLGGTATQSFTLDSRNTAPAVVGPLADRAAQDGQAVSFATAASFADANGDPLTYAATGLPKGLTIDPISGVVSGTLDPRTSASGPYTVAITATDSKGATTAARFTLAVADLPPTASGSLPDRTASDGAGITIAAAGGFADPNGVPLVYTATGLPKGLTIDPATGVISGTLDRDASAVNDGSYVVTVTASDGQGGSASQPFHLAATNVPPSSGMPTPDQANGDGEAITPVDASRAFTDPNGDALRYAASGLPSGLAIDPAIGIISGTVAGDTAPGRYTVTITATDSKGAATSETFRWTIADLPPTTQGRLPDQTVSDGQGGVAVATADGFASPNGLPLRYTATGLPAGLAIDPATGVISGTLDRDASAAASGGRYAVTVTADDGQGGTAAQSFVLAATNQAPSVVEPTPDQANGDGEAIVPVDASKAFSDPNGDPLSFSADGLPPGLSIDPATGLVAGTLDPRASAAGPYAVTITATDDKGAATSELFTWTVADAPPTAAGTLPDRQADDGSAVAIETAAGFENRNGLPLTYTATGLPAGLAIDPSTGAITGTIDPRASTVDGGLYAIIVTADDGQGGTVDQAFHLTVGNQAPVVGMPTPDQAGRSGEAVVPVDAGQAFADPNDDPLTFAASGLPAGLSIDPATGVISGSIAADAVPGRSTVTVTATDGKGAAAAESFAFDVAGRPPVAASALPDRGFSDGQMGIAIAASAGFTDPNGLPLTYSAAGLPPGLSIDPRTGIISGSLAVDAAMRAPTSARSPGGLDGRYMVTVTATDPYGASASESFAIDALHRAPGLAAQTPDQRGQIGSTIAPVDVGGAFDDPTGDRLSYAATGLPPGLAIDPATGVISGRIDAGLARPGTSRILVVATDAAGNSFAESFLFTVEPAPSSVLPSPSLIPYSALEPFVEPYVLPYLYGIPPVLTGLREGGVHPPVEATLPVLRVIDQTSGAEERSQVISIEGIVDSTVNRIAPLNGLQRLAQRDARDVGIVEAGANADEFGDRIQRARSGLARDIDALTTPLHFLGASAIEGNAADGSGISIETVLSERVLTLSLDNRTGDARDLGGRVGKAIFEVTLANGRPLPGWLHSDGNGILHGKVPAGVEEIDLRIRSTLPDGRVQERLVTIRTDRGTIITRSPPGGSRDGLERQGQEGQRPDHQPPDHHAGSTPADAGPIRHVASLDLSALPLHGSPLRALPLHALPQQLGRLLDGV